MEHSHLLLRLEALVWLKDRGEALRVTRRLAEGNKLTGEEACALCSACFASNEVRITPRLSSLVPLGNKRWCAQAATEVTLECLWLLLSSLTGPPARCTTPGAIAFALAGAYTGAPICAPTAAPGGPGPPNLLYVAAFSLQKSKEAGCPRSAAIRMARLLVRFVCAAYTCICLCLSLCRLLGGITRTAEHCRAGSNKIYSSLLVRKPTTPSRPSVLECRHSSAEGGSAYQEGWATTDPEAKQKVLLECTSHFKDGSSSNITCYLYCITAPQLLSSMHWQYAALLIQLRGKQTCFFAQVR